MRKESIWLRSVPTSFEMDTKSMFRLCLILVCCEISGSIVFEHQTWGLCRPVV